MKTMRLSGHILDIELLKPGTVHKFSPAAGTARNALPIGLGHDGRRVIRIIATAAVNIKFGGPTVEAAATDALLPADTVEYFDIWGNTYIAAYGSADVYVTEMDISSTGGGRWQTRGFCWGRGKLEFH